jgi:isoleucyl-tRNA synthetase
MDEADAWAVTLDTVITPELRKKGMARELVRHFMSLRKASGLQPNDRIHATAATEDPGLRDVLDSVKEIVAKDLRADSLAVGAEMVAGMTNTADITLDGKPVSIGLRKA